MPEVVFATDAQGRWTYLNPAWTRMTGFPVEDCIGLPYHDFVAPEERQGSLTRFSALLTARETRYRRQVRYRTASGDPCWVEVSVTLERDGEGRLTGSYGSMVEITARVRADAATRGEQGILEAIVGGAPLDTILCRICRLSEELTPQSRCSVLLLDPDGAHLRIAAAPSLPDDYNAAIDGVAAGIGTGSCGRAAVTGAPVIVADIATDPLWDGYRELALPHGLRACWSFPIIADGVVLGTFGTYYGVARAPDEAEMETAGRLAKLAAVAIIRSRTDEALRVSEERYAVAARGGHVGIWDIDLLAGAIHWSPLHKRMLGLSPSADPGRDTGIGILGETLERLIHPEDVAGVSAAYESHLARNTPYDVTFRINRPDGSIRWMQSRAEAVRDASGRAVRIAGSILDVTEKIESVEALRRSEQRFRDFTEVASDWLWETDTDFRAVFISGRAVDTLGIAPADMIGRELWEIVSEDTATPKWRRFHEDMEARRPIDSFEFSHRTPGGDLRHFRIKSRPILDERGVFQGYRGIGTDITAERNSADALRTRERELSEAQRIARTGDWLWHVDGRRVEWSDETYRIFGVDRRSFVPDFDNVFSFVHPDDRDAVIGGLTRSAAEKGRSAMEFRIHRADGEERHVWAQWQCSLNESGEVAHVFGVCRDITEQKKTEEMLRAAKDAAEAASRAKSEFLASMSHELRTPLNAIMGFSEVLKEQILGPLSERYRDYATDIHRSGQHLLDLISDLLNMARIEARQMEFQEETVPLSEIVEEAFRLTRLSPGETRQTVTKTLPDPMPVLRADRRALKQVLINLLGNAAKFTPEQGTVGLAVRHDPAGDLEITISDSGIGIPESRLPDLGKPFSRVENVMSRRYQGSGMGLFISKTLVERHGGTLTIASAEGHGTSVTVRLPAERLVAPDGNPEDRAAD
ncbi:PAS domain S-box protein [Skermanella sp. TT6]|uniref:histidine kinase n=1 Tax=Skermanella cutis TaxID=2775420 RepID=A0ABX7B2V7_9PROT|nr:PAS domain S-box protein [Skermanella sp. TT6]QQP87767.1 PAS domain S-box protein [Skermanella sp. TT6]